jgi:LysM repeat protein
MKDANMSSSGGGLGAVPTSTKLNTNQFGKTMAAGALGGPAGLATALAAPKIAQGIKAAAPIAAKAAGTAVNAGAGVARKVVGAEVNAGKAIVGAAGKVAGAQVNAARAAGGAVAKALPYAAKGAMLTNPLVAGGAAAYGASQTPGGKSIIKGAIKGAGGPNGGLGVLGAGPAAVKGAVTSQGGKNVLSGAAKGAAIGMFGGPVTAAAGGLIGGFAGLFSHRGMGQKPKAAPSAGVPNRATPYTVQKGDTLSSIAAAKGTSVDALRKANPSFTAPGSKYKNGNMIWSGTKVNLK